MSNEVPREREEEWRCFVMLSKSTIVPNLLTITKLLIAKPPLDQSQKSKLNPSHWITLLFEKVTRFKQLSHNKSRTQLSRDATNENHKNIKPTERMSNV
ncbi:hypothetical protein QL285_070674 [Trifolium repens]|nr:hypothetical protein QL285_070670 [Trifolium repens]KAK2383190.1 hypothetical protein QL285_070672 [Trifolium repens]KAK2383192.1 hypothetical protein QL285_070674 [Trifolium repens]